MLLKDPTYPVANRLAKNEFLVELDLGKIRQNIQKSLVYLVL